jgi:hypothetical protein
MTSLNYFYPNYGLITFRFNFWGLVLGKKKQHKNTLAYALVKTVSKFSHVEPSLTKFYHQRLK